MKNIISVSPLLSSSQSVHSLSRVYSMEYQLTMNRKENTLCHLQNRVIVLFTICGFIAHSRMMSKKGDLKYRNKHTILFTTKHTTDNRTALEIQSHCSRCNLSDQQQLDNTQTPQVPSFNTNHHHTIDDKYDTKLRKTHLDG